MPHALQDGLAVYQFSTGSLGIIQMLKCYCFFVQLPKQIMYKFHLLECHCAEAANSLAHVEWAQCWGTIGLFSEQSLEGAVGIIKESLNQETLHSQFAS